MNKIRGTFVSAAVKAPAFGDRRKAMLEDIAILTGGQVVAPEVGLKLDDVGLDVLGTARRVTITKDDTTIVDGAGSAEAVADRVRQLRAEIERTDSEWDRDKLQERVAKLAGGVAVIRVGAATEVELKEKKHRLEDAISATRAAVEEGIVAGGGSALVHAASALDKLDLVGDEATGVSIVRKALVEPLRWIAENAGLEGYVVTEKVAALDLGHGLNAATGEYADLIADGVIDPVKVTRSALANAASIAALLLTTETLVVEKPEEHRGRRARRAWAQSRPRRPQPLRPGAVARARRPRFARLWPVGSSSLRLWSVTKQLRPTRLRPCSPRANGRPFTGRPAPPSRPSKRPWRWRRAVVGQPRRPRRPGCSGLRRLLVGASVRR